MNYLESLCEKILLPALLALFLCGTIWSLFEPNPTIDSPPTAQEQVRMTLDAAACRERGGTPTPAFEWWQHFITCHR